MGRCVSSVFLEKKANGSAPVYMDCTKTSPEDIEYMKFSFKCEGIKK